MRWRMSVISPRSRAASTWQPGSWSWLQLAKRQAPRWRAKSGISAARSATGTWRRPNSWKPGESISAASCALSSQYQRVCVVVWRPEFSAVEISPTCAAASGTSRLTSVLLPVPEGPSTSVAPLESAARRSRASSGRVFSATSMIG